MCERPSSVRICPHIRGKSVTFLGYGSQHESLYRIVTVPEGILSHDLMLLTLLTYFTVFHLYS